MNIIMSGEENWDKRERGGAYEQLVRTKHLFMKKASLFKFVFASSRIFFCSSSLGREVGMMVFGAFFPLVFEDCACTCNC